MYSIKDVLSPSLKPNASHSPKFPFKPKKLFVILNDINFYVAVVTGYIVIMHHC